MARVLKRMNSAETTIVIAHGLASDALYGEFEAIDVVEKRGDVSEVRVAGVGVGPSIDEVEDDLVVQQRIAEAIEEVLPLQVNEQRVMNE